MAAFSTMLLTWPTTPLRALMGVLCGPFPLGFLRLTWRLSCLLGALSRRWLWRLLRSRRDRSHLLLALRRA